jgi:hypothetical protein
LSQRRENDHWINPLLSHLNLIEIKEANAGPQHLWKQIEENQLIERIGKLVAKINDAAGYHVLEMLEYLPPQENVLRINFGRNRAQYKMEIALWDKGFLLSFSSAKLNSARWERYFPKKNSMKSNSNVEWEQFIRPEEVMEENIQAWLSYLLSGLNREFRLDQILRAASTPEAGTSAILRKASA